MEDILEGEIVLDNQLNVHIRAQQRNGKKSLTIVEGLTNTLDLKGILKDLKKTLATNGTIKVTELGPIIQLQGDQRQLVSEYLVKTEICTKDEIRIHGA